MYYYTWYGYNPPKQTTLVAPKIKTTMEISVVIPVKNNQTGINRFLTYAFNTCPSEMLPIEIIVVRDHGVPIKIPEQFFGYKTEVKIIDSNGYGPASARNTGYKQAQGNWILFSDSDCIPSPNLFGGYLSASDGAVGYAGAVASFGSDLLSRYYESQRILIPSSSINESRPEYLVTANSLIWKPALEKVGGFNEEIKIAAGEDVDLGFRLREVGELSFAPHSLVYHDFNDGLVGFVKRFARYGKGNRKLADSYDLDIKPRPFAPAKKTFANSFLASVQYLSMLWGWHSNNILTQTA